MDSVNKEMVIVDNLITSIKMWVTLKIPRIEDGNNLGVIVQEEHIGLLTGMEQAVTTVMANSMTSFSSRGDYISDVRKFGRLRCRLSNILLLKIINIACYTMMNGLYNNVKFICTSAEIPSL